MSEPWYIVREDTRQVIDIFMAPVYFTGTYDHHMQIRVLYSELRNCRVKDISILKHKQRALNYKGIV